MKKITYLILLISAVYLYGCVSFNTNFPLIEKGFSFEQVEDLIGKPRSAASGPEDTKIYYYRLASSFLDSDGSDTREYYVVLKDGKVIGYGERTDAITMQRAIVQFNSAWNAVRLSTPKKVEATGNINVNVND